MIIARTGGKNRRAKIFFGQETNVKVYGNILALRRTAYIVEVGGAMRMANEEKHVHKNVMYDITKLGLSYLINVKEIARPFFPLSLFSVI